MVENPFLGGAGTTGGVEFFGRLIPNLFTLGFIVGIVVFIFIFIYGAVSWMSSGGDPNLIAAARSKVMSAVVGLVILLSIFTIINLVECFFGVGIRRYEIGPLNLTPVGKAICKSGGGSSNGATCGPSEKICLDELGNPFCWPAGDPCPI